jgi:hypothetical protein
MTDGAELMVAGEPCAPMIESLLAMECRTAPDGMVEFDGLAGPHLLRALMRTEALMMLEDADLMAAGRTVNRTPDRRRADAFVALAQAIAERVAAAGTARAG